MNYDNFDQNEFGDNAYEVHGWRGISWRVLGWETVPDQDTEWSGYEIRTGRIVCQMIGDDRHFCFNPEDATPLDDGEYCRSCGQIGCAWH